MSHIFVQLAQDHKPKRENPERTAEGLCKDGAGATEFAICSGPQRGIA
jgi:hypothetical protein